MDRDLVGSVIIEVYPNHGSWFDAGELRTFAEHNDTPALWEDTVREEFDPSEGERTHCPACNSGTLQAGVRALGWQLIVQERDREPVVAPDAPEFLDQIDRPSDIASM